MRNRIVTECVEFRVAGPARPRMISKTDQRQKTTPDSDGRRPIWTVRLSAFDRETNSTQMIFVEVAGEEPKVIPNEIAIVRGLTYVPWARVNRLGNGDVKAEVVDAYRAESVAHEAAARRNAA